MTNSNLEFLVEVIGRDESERVLSEFLKRGWSNGTKFVTKSVPSSTAEVSKSGKTKKRRRRVFGFRHWSKEESDRLQERAVEVALGQADGKVSVQKLAKVLAVEFNRTPAALAMKLFHLKSLPSNV